MKSEKIRHGCAGRIWTGIGFKSCLNNGSLEHDGAHWCRIHYPPAIEEKQRKRKEKWQAEWAEREARWAQHDKETRLMRIASEYLREHHPDIYQRLRKEVGL